MSYVYKYTKSLTQFSRSNRRSSTEAERRIWHHLRNRRLKGLKFRRQFPILNYIIDFYCEETKLGIELDGSQHITQKDYDLRRDSELKRMGIKILRFWENDVLTKTNIILQEILDYIENTL